MENRLEYACIGNEDHHKISHVIINENIEFSQFENLKLTPNLPRLDG